MSQNRSTAATLNLSSTDVHAPSAKPLFRAVSGRGSSVSTSPPSEARRAHDFYPTPPEPIRALLIADSARIQQSGRVWEPACGDGAMVREIRAAGIPCCASDLIDRGCPDSWVADYFTCLSSRARAIITNPPYNLINARDGHGRWLRHTLDMPGWDYLALLLSWDWAAAKANGLGDMLDVQPFSYCYLMRWKVDFTGKGSPPQRNAWFVWDRLERGRTEPGFRWIDRPAPDRGEVLL